MVFVLVNEDFVLLKRQRKLLECALELNVRPLYTAI